MRSRALLILPPLPAALAAPHAYTARAGATHMGCSRYGYTLRVPATWTVFG